MGVILNPISGTGQGGGGGAADLSNVTNGPLPVADGGTGATTASGARTALGALGTNDQAANSLLLNGFAGNYYRDPSNLSAAVAVNKGGTGATTAAGARTNLGLEILVSTAQGRISADSSDPTAQGTSSTLYYLPHVGNQIALPDGSGGWVLRSIGSGLSFNLATGDDLQGNPIANNAAYEVCVWDNAGTPELALRRWTSNTARGAGATLAYQDGIPVLDSDGLMRSVGAIVTNGSGNCQSSTGKRRMSNRYNRVRYVDAPLRTTPTSYSVAASTTQEWDEAGSGPYDEFRHVFFNCVPLGVQAQAGAFVGLTGLTYYDIWIGLDGVTQAGRKAREGGSSGTLTCEGAATVEGLHYLAAIESTSSGTSGTNNVAPTSLGTFASLSASGEW